MFHLGRKLPSFFAVHGHFKHQNSGNLDCYSTPSYIVSEASEGDRVIDKYLIENCWDVLTARCEYAASQVTHSCIYQREGPIINNESRTDTEIVSSLLLHLKSHWFCLP